MNYSTVSTGVSSIEKVGHPIPLLQEESATRIAAKAIAGINFLKFGSFITKSLMICFLCKNSKLEVYPLIYCSFLTYTAAISYTLNEMKSHYRLSFAYFSIFAGFKIEDIHE